MTFKRRCGLVVMTLAMLGTGVAAGEPLVLRNASVAPTIDGVPGEECWKQADWRLLRTLDGGAAKVGGTVALSYDQDKLYVAFRLDEPEPANMKAPKAKTNAPEVWGGEMLEWFINASPEKDSYSQLGWNPSGSQFNAKCEVVGVGSVNMDATWRPKWRVATKIGANSWTAEAAIPFAELGVNAPTEGSLWSMNLTRTRRVGGTEYSCLSPTVGGFHNPERFAEVWFGARHELATRKAVAANPDAPLKALVACWGHMMGYDMLLDATHQLERALGKEHVDIRCVFSLDGKTSSVVGWPRRYAELTQYQLVVIASVPAAAFSDRQLADLRRYVESGGHVLLAGDMDGYLHDTKRPWIKSPFAPLLPIAPAPTTPAFRIMEFADKTSPLFSGIPGEPPLTIYSFRSKLLPGATLLAAGKLNPGETGEAAPVIAERKTGQGSVLAFHAGYANGPTCVPLLGLLKGNELCNSPRYPLFWDNLVRYLTGRGVPHPAKVETIAAEKGPARLWFDILKDNNTEIFRPGAVVKVAAPVEGEATYPCEVEAVIETEGGASIPAGTHPLRDQAAGLSVTLPQLDHGSYGLRLELKRAGKLVAMRRCGFNVASPDLCPDDFVFSCWVNPMASEADERRIAADLRDIGFNGISYGGGITVDGGYKDRLRPYAEERFMSRMQEAGLRTRPCWYPLCYAIMTQKPKYTSPNLPDAAFPGKDFLPYESHWLEAFDQTYWGKMPLTDGATIGDELTALWIPFTARLAKGYQTMTGRPAPDERSPDYYHLLQYRLAIGSDLVWLARSAWDSMNPGKAFDSVLTPNSFAGHSSCLMDVLGTISSLGVPSPDEYHYGEPKFYQKTLKSAAIAWAATDFGRLARPAFTGGQLNNDYYMDFPEQVFATLSATAHEFHVFHFACASFERDGRQDPKFAAVAKRTTDDAYRIGRTLNHYERPRARVAMLYPHTAHLWLSMGKAFNDDYLKMTGSSEQYLGLTYGLELEFDLLRRMFGHVDILFDEQIRRGDLRDYDVFVLAYSRQVEERTLREIRRFARDGGTLLVTSDSGHLNELNAATGTLYDSLPATLGAERPVVTDYAETRLVDREPWSKGNALQPKGGAELLFTFPDQAPACVRGEVGRGEAIVLGEPLAALKANPAQLKLIDYVLNQKARLISKPDDGEFSAITFVAPRDRTRVFMVVNHNKADAKTTVRARGDEAEAGFTLADIVTGEKVPFQVKDGVLSFEVAVKDRWGRALALLERPPSSVEASVSAPAVKAGDDFMLLVRMLAKDGLPTRATLPFDLVVKEPSGKVRCDLSGVRVADNSVYVLKMKWPAAAAKGKWTATVSEKIGGASDDVAWMSE